MNVKRFVRSHPLVAYFGIAYALSLIAGLVIYGPRVANGEPVQAAASMAMFPVMVIGVGLTGIALTGLVDGRPGLRALFARMRRGRVGAGWYAAALLIPPALVLVVLLSFQGLVSPAYAPKVFPLGILFGVLAGYFEEIGWTGFAWPRLRAGRTGLAAALVLGVLWGAWHLPVVDFLGAASPHGAAWLPFFAAFLALVVAIRVLISWISANTGSVLLAQLLHASSTGFLVVLSPVGVTPLQEARWYAVYAATLWIVVAVVVARFGTDLARSAGVNRQPTPAASILHGPGAASTS
jgi:membrane protease YdiL (CAAX protease family)